MKINKVIKAGIIGLIATTVVYLIIFFLASVSFRTFAPLYMPWTVLLLIGILNKKNNKQQ